MEFVFTTFRQFASLQFLDMKSDDRRKNITVEVRGVSAKTEVGQVAASGVSRYGKKTRGKYDKEVLSGYEFSSTGRLMHKERVIDRKNDFYKELVIDTNTSEIVRSVEQPLSEHTGRGSAKDRK